MNLYHKIGSKYAGPSSMLMSEMLTCFVKGFSVVEQTDKEIEVIEDSQTMGFELARIMIIDSNSLKEFFSFRVALNSSASKKIHINEIF